MRLDQSRTLEVAGEDGLDPLHLHRFAGEVLRQARFGLRAAADLNSALEGFAEPPAPAPNHDAMMAAIRDSRFDDAERLREPAEAEMTEWRGARGEADDAVWASVLSFLSAAANVSKLLWGARNPESPLRPALRRALDVDDNSPLRPRTLRNHLEHFDERLETLISNGMQSYADLGIGPDIEFLRANRPNQTDAKGELRQFDRRRHAVYFYGEEYELQPMIDELTRLVEVGADDPWIT